MLTTGTGMGEVVPCLDVKRRRVLGVDSPEEEPTVLFLYNVRDEEKTQESFMKSFECSAT